MLCACYLCGEVVMDPVDFHDCFGRHDVHEDCLAQDAAQEDAHFRAIAVAERRNEQALYGPWD